MVESGLTAHVWELRDLERLLESRCVFWSMRPKAETARSPTKMRFIPADARPASSTATR